MLMYISVAMPGHRDSSHWGHLHVPSLVTETAPTGGTSMCQAWSQRHPQLRAKHGHRQLPLRAPPRAKPGHRDSSHWGHLHVTSLVTETSPTGGTSTCQAWSHRHHHWGHLHMPSLVTETSPTGGTSMSQAWSQRHLPLGALPRAKPGHRDSSHWGHLHVPSLVTETSPTTCQAWSQTAPTAGTSTCQAWSQRQLPLGAPPRDKPGHRDIPHWGHLHVPSLVT
ncbi:hypothetical protein BsWGS_08569 [Bradybaena similaris]